MSNYLVIYRPRVLTKYLLPIEIPNKWVLTIYLLIEILKSLLNEGTLSVEAPKKRQTLKNAKHSENLVHGGFRPWRVRIWGLFFNPRRLRRLTHLGAEQKNAKHSWKSVSNGFRPCGIRIWGMFYLKKLTIKCIKNNQINNINKLLLTWVNFRN